MSHETSRGTLSGWKSGKCGEYLEIRLRGSNAARGEGGVGAGGGKGTGVASSGS